MTDGAPCSASWLAKLAVTGGGPRFRKIGRFPVYTCSDLDEWVEAKITAPRRSTSVSA
jgi:predicted DNA-binding transcriptional regulator AlpA